MQVEQFSDLKWKDAQQVVVEDQLPETEERREMSSRYSDVGR